MGRVFGRLACPWSSPKRAGGPILRTSTSGCALARVSLDLADAAKRRDFFVRAGAESRNALIMSEGLLVCLPSALVATSLIVDGVGSCSRADPLSVCAGRRNKILPSFRLARGRIPCAVRELDSYQSNDGIGVDFSSLRASRPEVRRRFHRKVARGCSAAGEKSMNPKGLLGSGQ